MISRRSFLFPFPRICRVCFLLHGECCHRGEGHGKQEEKNALYGAGGRHGISAAGDFVAGKNPSNDGSGRCSFTVLDAHLCAAAFSSQCPGGTRLRRGRCIGGDDRLAVQPEISHLGLSGYAGEHPGADLPAVCTHLVCAQLCRYFQKTKVKKSEKICKKRG